MSAAQGLGCVLLALAAYLALRGVLEFKAGIATLKFKWTYPQLEADQADDPVGFWLLTIAKMLIVGALAYFGLQVVLAG